MGWFEVHDFDDGHRVLLRKDLLMQVWEEGDGSAVLILEDNTSWHIQESYDSMLDIVSNMDMI